ncbi:MAG: precorrin-3B C(17)-methyltransferase [Deltaproteobacteria bacterium]|jgi:precorrin-3B C17-methyltransferase|nr:precorrin-3B C(17)-methyltransferase [Deltaproteobacteria bacterium]
MRSSSHVGSKDGDLAGPKAEKPRRDHGGGENELLVIGLGSKGPAGITLEARKALEGTDVVIGYKLYIEQAEPWLSERTKRVSSVMTEEIKRAEEALETAVNTGGRIAIVSGGDPGLYAMAGVVYELAASKKIPLGKGKGKLRIRVIPGTPALVAGAALLGAPITHDFCTISLSDRLTEWDLIKKRLILASQSDFVIVIYNPKSYGRTWQLGEAKMLLLDNLKVTTPVGICSKLGRHGEKARIVTLRELEPDDIDMQTILIVGNSTTFVYDGCMITPRGYVKKYGPGRPHQGEDDGEPDEA